MNTLTDTQRLEAAIAIASGRNRKDPLDMLHRLEVISFLGLPDGFLRANIDKYQEFIPDFMEETE